MWDRSQLKKYDFAVEDIPRYQCDDPKVDECIAQDKPVVVENSNLVRSAMDWNLDYLEKNMSQCDCPVLFSPNNKFKYFLSKPDDLSMNWQNKPSKYLENFEPPTRTVVMKIGEFHKCLKSWKEGDKRMYLQCALKSSVVLAIIQDYVNFRWDWIRAKQEAGSWGRFTSSSLFIGMAGNITPCHYDEQQNLFAQIKGYKRCILFPPEQFDCLYPHPVFHPHDRQSQVDFDEPDYERFPKFKEAKGVEAVVGPGDVLYIPKYWWHHVESLPENEYTISLNFWHMANPKDTVVYPLKGHQKVAIMRNIEKLLTETLNDPDEVGPLLRALVMGRFTD